MSTNSTLSSQLASGSSNASSASWGRRILRAALWCLGVVLLLAVGAAVWGVVWGPEFVEEKVRGRLASLGDRLGYEVHMGAMEVPDKTRVVLRDVRVERTPELRASHKAPLLQVPEVIIHLDLFAAMTRRIEVERVDVHGPVVSLVRLEDGSNDIEPLIERIQTRLTKRSSSSQKTPQGISARIARRLPAMRVSNGRLLMDDRFDPALASRTEHPLQRLAQALQSPLREVSNISLDFDSPDGALGYGSSLKLSGTLHEARSTTWTLPKTISMTAQRKPPNDKADTAQTSKLQGWSLESQFDPPINVPKLPRFERFGLSVGGVVVDNVQTLKLRDLKVTSADQTPPLLHAHELDISTGGIPTGGLSKLSINDVTLRKAALHLVSPKGEGMDPRVILRRLLGQAPRSDAEHSAPPEDREVAVEGALNRLRVAPKRIVFEDSSATWQRTSKRNTPIVWKLSKLRGHLEHSLLEHSLLADVSFTVHDTVETPSTNPTFSNALRVHGRYGYRSQEIDAHVDMDGVNLRTLTERLEIEKARALQGGWASGKCSLKNQKSPKTWTLDLDLGLSSLHVSHPMLSSHDVRDVDAKISGSLSWAPEAGNLVLNRGRFTLEDAVTVRANVGLYGVGHGHRRAAADFKEFKLRVAMSKTPAQEIFEAVPKGMRPDLDGMRLKGSVGFTLDVDADARNLRQMKTKSNVDLDGFGVVSWNEHADVRRMRTGFKHSVVQPETGYVFNIADTDEEWTPLPSVSPYFIKAIRTNEDGSFYSHQGFSWKQVKSSIERNVREGRFVRGASTVSMQVVKNIFLSHKKTVARKLQEAFLTFLMEQVEKIPKNRILEIYANIVELGPRVYGIRAAAQYYFGRGPRNLTIPQAVFLVSILPGPRKYHSYYERGWISEGWWQRMKRLIDVMLERNHITEEEHAIAMEKKPYFSKRKAKDGEESPSTEDPPEDEEETDSDEEEGDGAARGALFGRD